MDQMSVFLLILAGCLLFFVLIASFGGDASGGDADAGVGGHDDGGIFTSNILAVRNLFLFGAGFGAGGAIATYLGCGVVASSAWGIGVGVCMVVVVVWFYALVRRQQSNTVSSPEALVGKHAVVVTEIPENGIGEISATNEYGALVYIVARTRSGEISIGEKVIVKSVEGHTATVALIPVE